MANIAIWEQKERITWDWDVNEEHEYDKWLKLTKCKSWYRWWLRNNQEF
jgi:hypothetical protein